MGPPGGLPTPFFHDQPGSPTAPFFGIVRRLRHNRPLTPDDLSELEQLLLAAGGQHVDIVWAQQQTGGLGLFIRSLIGLEQDAVTQAFEQFLDSTRYSVEQVRYVQNIVRELTNNGVMEPNRLYELPYTDHAPQRPDDIFTDAEVTVLFSTLKEFQDAADPRGAA